MGADTDRIDASHVSIVIPAFDEAQVIGETLAAVLAQDFAGSMEVVVAANGCTDDTADTSRTWQARFEAAGHRLTVVELDDPLKYDAINAAEAGLPPSHRIYLDADVVPSPNAVRRIAETLDTPGLHLCAPTITVATSSSRWTRSYFRAWLATAAVREDVVGAGLLAVSESGRRRWSVLPPVVADDYFIRSHFDPAERLVVPDASFRIRPPEGMREVITTRSRWIRGEVESDRPRPARGERGWRSLLRNRQALKDLPTYLVTIGCATALARRHSGTGPTRWERSSRSRQPRATTRPPSASTSRG